MVVIIYGICSEGMGHATRSKIVIEELIKKGHEVHIFTSGRAYDFLKKSFDTIYEIKPFNLIYDDNKLKTFKSTVNIIETLPIKLIPSLKNILSIIVSKKPKVVITDHEVLTAIVAKHIGVPTISVSNINILTRAKTEGIMKLFNINWALNSFSTRMSNYMADYYVIPTFFTPDKISKNIYLTAPPVRKKIVDAKISKKDHILVYHTTPTAIKLIDILKEIDEKFVVYGFGKRKNFDNIIFKDFSEDEFISYLSSAKAIITGGGFSLISEALYLKKPILSTPVKNQYEQMINAYYLQKMKYGLILDDFNKEDVIDFILQLPRFEYYLNKYDFNPYEYKDKILDLIDKEISKKIKLRYEITKSISNIIYS